jgi:hypothetical protein
MPAISGWMGNCKSEKEKKYRSLCRAFYGRHTAKWPYLAASTGPLPCVLCLGARQRVSLPCIFPPVHGKGRHTPSPSSAVSCFYLSCAAKKRTAKTIYRALLDAAHAKGALPCKMLSCALCRAPRRKTHGKEFAMRFRAFAVWRASVSRSEDHIVTEYFNTSRWLTIFLH